MNINGNLSTDATAISSHIIDYYSNLFHGTMRNTDNFSLVHVIVLTMVTNSENTNLTKMPDESKIRNAFFSMDGSSAPGPDGFTGMFFKKFWDSVKTDVCCMVYWFFTHGELTTGLNSNLMVLLPKKNNAVNIEEFRPIVMSNFGFKIASKILASRLANIVDRIVSPNQFRFIRNRSIHQCIAIDTEGVNLLNKSCYGGNAAMKIDIKKAFDTLEWSFLMEVMRAFGFSTQFCDWIVNILSYARISIMTSSGSHGYFPCSRGVRQGDLLSPIIYGIAEDFFSRLLSIWFS